MGYQEKIAPLHAAIVGITRRLSFAAGAAVLAGGFLAAPLKAETVTIKVATFVPEKSTGVSKVIKPWMEAVARDAGGDVKMQAFWGGTLGKSPFKQYELVKNGVADVTWVLPGYTAGQFPELQVMELPFFAKSGKAASVAGWKLHEQGLLSGLEDVHLVGFFASAPSIVFSRGEMTDLASLSGKKYRSVGAVHAAWLESIGSAPQTMSSAEMNEALNRDILDGVIQGWTGMRTFKTLPLVTHVYDVPIGVIPFLLIMNKKTWEKLSPKAKEAVMKHGGLAMAQTGGAAYDELADSIQAATLAEGKITPVAVSDAQMAKYASESLKVHDWWIAKTTNGQKVYDSMKAELEAAGN